MSSFLYGYAARGPTKSENPFLPTSDAATQEDQDNAQRAKQFVEMVAGLVPAEVLAVQTFIYEVLGDRTGSSDETAAKITNVEALRWSFAALLVIALAFYLGGTTLGTLRRKYVKHHFFRCLVILLAFGVWTWFQPVSAWQSWVDLGEDVWLLIGALAAVAVTALNAIVVSWLKIPSS